MTANLPAVQDDEGQALTIAGTWFQYWRDHRDDDPLVDLPIRRTEFLEKRAKLMQQWGRYVSTAKDAGKVVAIGRGKQ